MKGNPVNGVKIFDRPGAHKAYVKIFKDISSAV